jgi:hypothetical protein
MGRLTVKDKPKYQVRWDGTIGKYYLTKTLARVRLASKACMKILATRKLRGTNRAAQTWKKTQKKV